MTGSMLDDAFAHHIWATERLIDTCEALDPQQLDALAPGTYGSIHRTLHHLVESDRWYLRFYQPADTLGPIEEEPPLSLASSAPSGAATREPGPRSLPARPTPMRTWSNGARIGSFMPRPPSAWRRSSITERTIAARCAPSCPRSVSSRPRSTCGPTGTPRAGRALRRPLRPRRCRLSGGPGIQSSASGRSSGNCGRGRVRSRS